MQYQTIMKSHFPPIGNSFDKLIFFRKVIFLLCLLALLSYDTLAQKQTKEHYQSTLQGGTKIGYLSYLPPAYNKNNSEDFPLLIFLHGLGETGSNLDLVARNGPPMLINQGKWPEDRPFVVISPQTSSTFYNSWGPALVNNVIDHVVSKYRIDESRIYITGLSLGGHGSWNYATQYPDRVAAVVPVCGRGNVNLACKMEDVPLWAFHNEGDNTVHVNGTKNMMDALDKCASKADQKATIYPKQGHNAWSNTYDLSSGHDIYSWMLSHTNKRSSAPSNKAPVANAGGDKTLTLPNNSITLNGSAKDQDGSIASYHWTKVSGPSATLKDTDKASLKLSNLMAGNYVFRLSVRDNQYAMATDDVTLTVKPLVDQGNGPVTYAYYEGNWTTIPDFSSLTPQKTGKAHNFTIDVSSRDDGFGIQFSSFIEVPASGEYTFYTTSDDGSKLYINGKAIVNNDGMHGAQEKSGKVYLSKGAHAIRVDYFESSGGEVLEVRYAGPGISKQLIPNQALKPTDIITDEPPLNSAPDQSGYTQGLSYAYYEGTWYDVPDFSALAPVKTGQVPNFDLSPAIKNDFFGFVFEGKINISKSGEYTFYAASDDGNHLYINNKKVVDNGGMHSRKEASGKIYLDAGMHDIKATYFESRGSEVLEVRYSGPGVSKQLIPNNVLMTKIGDIDQEVDKEIEADEEPSELSKGLTYAYYEGTWYDVPDFSALKPIKTGTVTNFDLSPAIKKDFFGFVFEGKINIEKSGEYTFYAASDDGNHLYINNKKVVNNGGMHSRKEASGKIYLDAGLHDIKATYFESRGDEVLEVRYSGPGVSKQLIPDHILYNGDDNGAISTPKTEQGLVYAYYEGSWLDVPDFSKLKPIKTGTIENFDLSPANSKDYFGFTFEGNIEIKQSGEYTFYTASDDGNKLYINNKEIIDNGGMHARKEKSGKVYLQKGSHAIKVTYFERTGNEILEVQYSGPGISKQFIPNEVLFSLENQIASNVVKRVAAATPEEEPSLDMAAEVQAYPNPFTDYMDISLPADDYQGTIYLSLTNISGETVHKEEVNSTGFNQTISISTVHLNEGIYFLQIVKGAQVNTIRVIKH